MRHCASERIGSIYRPCASLDESFKTENPVTLVVRIIGASTSPTPFKVRTPKEQYVYCGADILLNGVQHDLKGEARCIVCGRSTRVVFVDGRISMVEPFGAVLHVVEIRSPSRTQVVCEGSPLFDRDECLQSWLKDYKGLPGQVYAVEEFMPRALELVSEHVGPAGSELKSPHGSKSVRVMRCADCDCSPMECAVSNSAIECPSCRLGSCCCWVDSSSAS